MTHLYRTHTCGELTTKQTGKRVKLSGWVHSRRDHGGLIFLDLRDRYGITQVTFNPKISKEAWKTADQVRSEYVVTVEGKVTRRPKDMINPKLATGEIEVMADRIEILSKAKTPPFEITCPSKGDKEKEISEDVRLKWRYLDLRQERIKDNILLRDKIIKFIRDFLTQRDFVEIETPILGKSTPEGARDYLVPSRLYWGKFYSLPQSPQQYKQLLMVAGFDKYFQIARCFRDEDTRADRQPEFTQLDLEMSFVTQKEILDLCEELFTQAIEKLTDKKILKKPWPRLKYKECIEKYGIDKPDLRFGMELVDVTEIVKGSKFKVFQDAIKNKGVIKGLVAPGCAEYSRKQLDELVEYTKQSGAKGLAWLALKHKKVESPIAKFFSEHEINELVSETRAKEGDLLLFVADKPKIVAQALGELRSYLGDKLKLKDPNVLACCFIIEWPLFEWNEEEKRLDPCHHIFTAPKEEDVPLLDKEPLKVGSWQHDLVINGWEIGGGSIRIHERKLQEKIFELLEYSKKEIEARFGHLLRAFEHGAPPHGGIAPGIDRFLMVLQGELNIREVIAFPKNQAAQDLMMGAPAEVEEKQLKELGIEVKEKGK